VTVRFDWRRLLLWGLLGLVAWLAASWLLRLAANRAPAQRVESTPAQIERGRYLAAAADCAACHTAQDGAPFAGGVPLNSPFGTIHGTNITPDAETGIGRYTADEFFHAMTRGEARDGRQLYPAMPYVSYRTMTREDSDAIYAYAMSQPPVRLANPANSVRFPYNIRSGINLWNLLFARAEPVSASTGESPDWQRGRYLVETLGHCGECHTPRGALGQVDRDRPLAGNASLGRLAAPDITPEGLAARGFGIVHLREYLATGLSAPAAASGEMLTVVQLSTSELNEADLVAMTTYLLGDEAASAEAAALADAERDGAWLERGVAAVTTAESEAPRRHYLALCAGCHGPDGEGVPHVAVALHGNSGIRDLDPHNLVVAILDGFPEHDFVGLDRMQDMPGFARELGDAEVAALATWLRKRYGGQASPVAAEVVGRLRANTTSP
jgi:mono/diheme cytochrome c family protein